PKTPLLGLGRHRRIDFAAPGTVQLDRQNFVTNARRPDNCTLPPDCIRSGLSHLHRRPAQINLGRRLKM
ncbi:MAG: hypothetical protein WB611_00590, partial [Stellaceae bacterium]